MKHFSKIATDFASALVDSQFDIALSLLVPELQQQYSSVDLAEEFNSMFDGYSQGSPTHIYFDKQSILTHWPRKRNEDVGWVYVSIIGDDFVEVIAVIISDTKGGLLISDIEWGRP